MRCIRVENSRPFKNRLLRRFSLKAIKNKREDDFLDINVGDKIVMRKKHPCGCDVFKVSRIGMDFKIVCIKCGHEIMLPRKSVEKSIKKIVTENGEIN